MSVGLGHDLSCCCWHMYFTMLEPKWNMYAKNNYNEYSILNFGGWESKNKCPLCRIPRFVNGKKNWYISFVCTCTLYYHTQIDLSSNKHEKISWKLWFIPVTHPLLSVSHHVHTSMLKLFVPVSLTALLIFPLIPEDLYSPSSPVINNKVLPTDEWADRRLMAISLQQLGQWVKTQFTDEVTTSVQCYHGEPKQSCLIPSTSQISSLKRHNCIQYEMHHTNNDVGLMEVMFWTFRY